jgi:type VI secretion system secreted protein Hcp
MRFSREFRRVAFGSMVGASALMATSQALAAWTAFVSIKGVRQGQFKAEGVQRKDKWIPVVAFTFGAKSPRDPATGAGSGKRQYEPACFTKEWGAATPQIFQALSGNEVLPEVVFEFNKTSREGAEYVYQTVKLSNATVASVRQFTGHPAGDTRAATAEAQNLEEVCFTFQKVEMTNNDGKTSFMDDWRATP